MCNDVQEADDENDEVLCRVTEADKANDTKSLERKLDRRLFLMLKRKGNPRTCLSFPLAADSGFKSQPR